MLIEFRRLLSKLFFASLILVIFFVQPFQAFASQKTDVDLTKLKEKIAKGYSNKFCNAIGIGMSKESAAKLAVLENKNLKFNSSLWIDIAFSGSKTIESIQKDEIRKEIVKRISFDCGYPIGLNQNAEELEEFEQFFNQIQQELE